jgi:hypothetical protein
MFSPLIVFVLGAGASRDAGLPLYGELLNPAYLTKLQENIACIDEDSINSGTPQIAEHSISQFLKVGGKLKAQWIKAVDSYRKACIQFIQDGSDLEELLQRYSQEAPDRERQLLKYYSSLIQFVDEVYQGSGLPRYLIHFWFWVSNLIKNGTRVAMITFNHDMLVEFMCSYIHANPSIFAMPRFDFSYYLDPDYCKTVGELVEERFQKKIINEWNVEKFKAVLDIDRSCTPVPILKLHGSFNWMLCPCCEMTIVSTDTIDADTLSVIIKECQCPGCGLEMKSGIIPPKRVKEFSGLKKGWGTAEALLQIATKIMFIGYSLPSYDKEAFELFSNCIPRGSEIYVVSKSFPPELFSDVGPSCP